MNEQLNDDPFAQNTLPEYKEGVAPPPPPPSMNEGQQKAHDRTVSYVTGHGDNLPKIILIRGFAGTGKTFTTNRIVKSLSQWQRSPENKESKTFCIAASAPTHKAVRVLRKAGDLGTGITYATIHSLLGLRPEPEEENGKQVFKKSTNPEDGSIQDYNVLILDEISQLGEALWAELIEAMQMYNFKLILLGDAAQIPPVKEKDSLPFLQAEEYGIEILTLDQSMRQAGDNPILDYATEIRKTYKGSTWINPHVFAKVNEAGHGIEIYPGTDTVTIRQLLEDKFGSDQFRADADHMKVIAWTNRTVDRFNNEIRRMLYPVPEGMAGLPMIVHGEKLIMDERYVAAGEFKPVVLPTNEEVEVEKYEVVKKAVSYWTYSPLGKAFGNANPTIYQALVRFRGIHNQWIKATLNIVHEKSQREVADILDKISKSAKNAPFGHERREVWKHFWDVKGMFAQIKYNYAVTAHKSQGSTYDNCVAVMYDIKANPKYEERNRIMYVAATRARNKLYIIE